MISQFDDAGQYPGRLVKRQVPTKNVFSFFKLMNMEISNQRFLHPRSMCTHVHAISFSTARKAFLVMAPNAPIVKL